MYKYNGSAEGKSVGFCRLDISGDSVKVFANIKGEMIGIKKGESVENKAFFLRESGEKQEFKLCNGSILVEDTEAIVGILLVFIKPNGIRVQVSGLLENRCFEENAKSDIEVVESIEDTEIQSEFVKFKLEDITMLPRGYWHFAKNRFLLCGYKKYGYLAYTKKKDRYIICVPGVMNEGISGCARKHGFKSFVPFLRQDNESSENGYWMMN